MATVVELPVEQDVTIYKETDWQQFDWIFYEDLAQQNPVDFSLSTFAGELVDIETGDKLYDLTFNTPADDGRLFPQLTNAQAAALVGRTARYFATVTTSGIIQGYLFGKVTISGAFVAGS